MKILAYLNRLANRLKITQIPWNPTRHKILIAPRSGVTLKWDMQKFYYVPWDFFNGKVEPFLRISTRAAYTFSNITLPSTDFPHAIHNEFTWSLPVTDDSGVETGRDRFSLYSSRYYIGRGNIAHRVAGRLVNNCPKLVGNSNVPADSKQTHRNP